METFDKAFIQRRYEVWEQRTDPEFAELMAKLTFQGLYQRKVLDQKTREFIAIAALTAINAPPQLARHIEGAFSAGATSAEIKEVIIQMVTYCGVPYMGQAFGTFEEVAKRLGKEV